MIQRNGQTVAGFSIAASPADDSGLGGFCLPSGDAALRLIQGKPGALVDVGATMLTRGALVATGLAIAGFRNMDLLKGTLGAVLAIETGVLAWAWKSNREM
jgi:hypothetical protein